MKERSVFVDNAKGLGILLVIIGHLVPRDSYTFIYIFAFHMPLFFLISGYLLNPKKFENFSDCVKYSYKHYIKPYIAFCIIGFVISLPVNLGGVIIGKHDAFEVLSKMLYMVFWEVWPFCFFMGSIWFLVVLFFAVIWGWLILTCIQNRYRCFVIFLLPCVSYMLFLLQKASFMPSFVQESLPFRFASVPISTMFILMGYELKIHNVVIKFSYVSIIALVFSAVCIPLNGYVNISTPQFNNLLLYVVNAVAGSYVIFSLSGYKWPNFIGWIGKNSLIIFAMHSVWITIYSVLIAYMLGFQSIYTMRMPLLYGLIGAIVVAALSMPTIKVIQPILNFIIKKL